MNAAPVFRRALPFGGLLLGLLGSAHAQAAPRDTVLVLPREGEVTREAAAGHVAAVRLESGSARVTAGATYRALRLRLSWRGAAGTVRLRADVPARLQSLLQPVPDTPR